MTDSQESWIVPLPPDKKKIRRLWTVAAILGAVTVAEFAIAFSMESGVMKTAIFVIMTIVKAAYIVGEFMHLRYEVKALIWSILIPMLFIAWLILALIYEGFYLPGTSF